MYIIAEKTKAVYERTEESCLDCHLDFFLNSEKFAEYTRILREIAEESKYTAGEQIMDSDLDRIKAGAKDVINSISEVLANKEVKEEEKLKYNSLPTLIALTDHLFATAMKELGSPDIPSCFGKDVEKCIKTNANNINNAVKRDLHENISADTHYHDQRKQNADKVEASNKDLMIKCRLKSASTVDVATLAAEYQALHRRQEGHGAIWRFFHGKENEARTKLLGDMKSALQGVLGEGVSLLKNTPQKIAESMDGRAVDTMTTKAFDEMGLYNRVNCHYTDIRYEAKNSDRAIAERENKKRLVSINGDEVEKGGIENANDADIRSSMQIDVHELDGDKNNNISEPVVKNQNEKEVEKNAAV